MTGQLVVDTNVVVAALLTSDSEAPTAVLLDAMLGGGVHFLLSVELLAEYRAVLLRPQIVSRHGLTAAEIDEILLRLSEHAAVREPPLTTAQGVPRGDRHLADLLAQAPGAVLVTGDEALRRRFGVRSASPRQMVQRMR